MSVVPSIVITEGSATSSEDLWPLAHLLRPDWSGGVTTRTEFSTDIVESQSVAEQRRGLLGKPTHGCEALLRSIPNGSVRAVLAVLYRSTQGRGLYPLFSDQMLLTAPASGTSLTCDTTFKRVFVGGRVVVHDRDQNTFTVAQISAVASGSITLTGSLGATFGIGSYVWPLIEARVELAADGTVITDGVTESTSSGIELPGPWALDAVQSLGSTPSGYTTYGGYPILTVFQNYAKNGRFSLSRVGNYSGAGITQQLTTYGDRAKFGRTLPFSFLSRAEFWKFLTLWESRGGRLYPFWVPSPTTDYEVTEWTAGGLKVKAIGPITNYKFWPYISIVKKDGTVQVRHITNVSRAGTIDTITLDSGFSTPDTNLLRVSIAHLMRCASDELVEHWLTDTVCEVDLQVEELIDERSITIADLPDPIVDPGPIWTPVPVCVGVESLTVPTFFWPCPAPSERPLGRAVNFIPPEKIIITIDSDISIDATFPMASGGVTAELLAALPGSYACSYVGPLDAGARKKSRHWHHTYVHNPGSGLVFGHEGTGSIDFVKRYLWRVVREYQVGELTKHITVDVVAEWDDRPSGVAYGAAGVLWNVRVHADTINPSYVEGNPVAAQHNATFTESDPAVWGGLVSGATNADKYLHPNTLLYAYVPTSWTAPCGNTGKVCGDERLRGGFATCDDAPLNGAPWVENDPTICPKNVVFTEPTPGTHYRAMTLGGECPQSKVFPFLLVENRIGAGMTALKPGRSGWIEETGELSAIGGSTMHIFACSPAQNRVSCCDENADDVQASPQCWSAPDDAPTVCCFPTDADLRLTITQKCLESPVSFDGDCVPLDLGCIPKVHSTGTTIITLTPCDVTYGSRSFTWEGWVPDKAVPPIDVSDDFDASGGLSWSGTVGTDWQFTDGTAHCDTPDVSGGIFKALATLGTYRVLDFQAEVDVIRGGLHGLRFLSDDGTGYAVLADATSNVLSLYRVPASGPMVLLSTATSLPLSAPYRLVWSRKGPKFSASIEDVNGASVSATDCSYESDGIMCLAGNSSVKMEWDNFEMTAIGAFTQIVVSYSSAGWSVLVPEGAMPMTSEACVTEGDPLAGTPGHCPADYTVRYLSPISVNAVQGSLANTAFGPPGVNNLVQPSPSTPCNPPFPDWQVVLCEVIPKAISCATSYSDSLCNGFGYWEGLRVA